MTVLTEPVTLPQVGQVARLVKRITAEQIEAFARLSGDSNPLHLDSAFASQTPFRRPVAHGMLLASYVSTLVGMHLPGPGALWTRQSFLWKQPVFAGDTVELTLLVKHVSTSTRTVVVEVNAVNQEGNVVMEGEGAVMIVELSPDRNTAPPAPVPGRLALVTGASGEIGAAVARRLAAAEMNLGVHYAHHPESAAAVCRTIQHAHGAAIPLQADLSDPVQTAAAIQQLQHRFTRPVDVLVHCASLPVLPKPFLETGWEHTQQMLDVFVRGAWNCARAVLPSMVERRSGVLVFLGSALPAPPAQWSPFLIAKGALHSLVHSLAAEFGPSGIRVNMVSPGMVNTATVAAIPERLRKVSAMQSPLRRSVTVDEVAEVVAFLCSEAASALTGLDVPVCAGAVMT